MRAGWFSGGLLAKTDGQWQFGVAAQRFNGSLGQKTPAPEYGHAVHMLFNTGKHMRAHNDGRPRERSSSMVL